MAIYRLNDEIAFPYPELSEEDGLLAIGGDLRLERLLLAYSNGIFPWYNENQPILWWATKPRFVLFPNEINITKSMKKLIKSNKFEVTFNKDFKGVISGCRNSRVNNGEATWISKELLSAYVNLFVYGYAISAEVHLNDRLVGGVYGVKIGKCFFGESMFAEVSNASKIGLIYLAKKLEEEGFVIMDCQTYSQHLESMGARFIEWKEFKGIITKHCF